MNDNEIISFYIEQKEYNSKKAKINKNLHLICSSITIFCSIITIPVIAVQDIPSWISIISATLTALIQSFNNLCKFQEKWIYYRTVTEELKSEYRKYSSHIFEYKGLSQVDADIHFSENLESIISERNNQWKSYENKNRLDDNKL